jgi:glycosyltransferase involved in cell wall biosynthesis
MKICFICPEYPPGPHGGVGTFTQVVGRALAQAGHQVRVAGIYPPSYPAPDYEEDQGVRVWRLRDPRIRSGWLWARLKLYRLIAQWAQAGEIDIVESPDSRGWFAGWPKLPVPLVLRSNGSLTYFGYEASRRVKPLTFHMERLAYRRVDNWSAVSRHTGSLTRRLFNLPADPGAILYNPVNVPDEVPPFEQRQPDQIIYTGTLTHKKGIVSLIDAWPAVKAKHNSAELSIYGKGEGMQEYLLKRVPEALHNSIHFRGHVSREKLFQALATSRVAVFPSFSEAFALAPLEAMACGCPTVYTKLTSGPETIRDGTDGLLVDPNHPDEIADALLNMLKDDALAKRLSESGRDRVVNTFTIKQILPMNEQFFTDVIHTFAA